MGKFFIGFDEETGKEFTPKKQEFEEQEEEFKKPKVDTRDDTVYLSPEKIAALKEEMSVVVVHEFGDEYHLSEEERKEANQFYEAFKKFRTYKRTYRKLDEFIVVVREALKCLDAVAETNGVYDPDKFKVLWLKGKVKINGLKLPKYRGRDRKALGWKYISEFIMGDDDPKRLVMSETDENEPITDEDFEREEKRLFDPGQLDREVEKSERSRLREIRYFDAETEEQEFGDTFSVELDKKETKALLQITKELPYVLKNIKRKERSRRELERYSFDLMEDDMEAIELQNKKYGIETDTSSDIPDFKGDVLNSDDYHRYMYMLKEYENNNTLENYGGNMKSLKQIQDLEVKQQLEAEGWNLRKMWDNRAKEKRFKRLEKAEKKREKLLKNKLLAIKERKDARKKVRRMGEDFYDDSTEKKKSKKKIKKGVKKIKDRKKEQVDELLLRFNDSDAATLDELGEDILDFRMGAR